MEEKTMDTNTGMMVTVPGMAHINRSRRMVAFTPTRRRLARGSRTARGRMVLNADDSFCFEPLRSLRSEAVVKHRTPHGSLSRTKAGRLRITLEFPLYPRTEINLQLAEEMDDMCNFVFNHFDNILV